MRPQELQWIALAAPNTPSTSNNPPPRPQRCPLERATGATDSILRNAAAACVTICIARELAEPFPETRCVTVPAQTLWGCDVNTLL
jgi:hypothetical protein